MAAKFEKTRTPGIYKRGSKYAFSYRVEGRQKWEFFATLDQARRAKAKRKADIDSGEYDEQSNVTLKDYAETWVASYRGRGRNGFREGTRDEYKRQLDAYVLPYFGTIKLSAIKPKRVNDFVGHLCEQTRPAPTKDDPNHVVPLSDATVRNIMSPLRACLASAVREGLIRHNPAREVVEVAGRGLLMAFERQQPAQLLEVLGIFTHTHFK